jgi:hypothetical protein
MFGSKPCHLSAMSFQCLPGHHKLPAVSHVLFCVLSVPHPTTVLAPLLPGFDFLILTLPIPAHSN